MIRYGNKFTLMDADGTFVGLHDFAANINGSDRFYYRDENGTLLVSEEGQWIGNYLPTIRPNYKEEVKTEDVMVSIEKTINDAFKKFGDRFGKLLEEKMNEIEENIAQADKTEENLIITQEEYDLEILNAAILKEMKEQRKKDQKNRGSKNV